MAESELTLGRSLRAKIERRDGTTRVVLSGVLDESANLKPIAEMPGPMAIDLADLRRINSVGVRDWRELVKTREKAAELVIERCSPAMVSQMSMISHFMGTKPHVRSLLVPYVCTACKAEHLELLAVTPEAQIKSELACPKCRGRMEVDELLETYNEALRAL